MFLAFSLGALYLSPQSLFWGIFSYNFVCQVSTIASTSRALFLFPQLCARQSPVKLWTVNTAFSPLEGTLVSRDRVYLSFMIEDVLKDEAKGEKQS